MVTDALQSALVERLHREVTSRDAEAFRVHGSVTLDSAYAASEFAAAATAVAGLAAREALVALDPTGPVDAAAEVVVDRACASRWFDHALDIPDPVNPWDALAGDYPTADGWLRLHTNAPHHRAAALRALGLQRGSGPDDEAPDRATVAAAVAERGATELETAVVEAGGAAAEMRSFGAWMRHPQGAAVAAEPLVAWQDGGEDAGRADGSPTAHALRGIRVLDLTRVIAGPVATRFLAGLGADVLRIDPPDWDEPAIVPEMTLGKRVARLDAAASAGREQLADLVRHADVVVHGYRPGALEHLGLGDLDALRPGIVDVAIDAYGWTGPWAGRRGFDSLLQMSSGLAEEGMRWFGRDRPTPLPVQALDHATGLLAAAAALEAIARRRATGRGSRARLSLARTALELAGAGRGDVAEPAPLLVGRPRRTPWGPGQLLDAPVSIGALTLEWERDPRPLGTDAPAW